jgi:hypothetical protein
MLAILLGFFRLIWRFGKDHRGVVLENLALRQQLSVCNVSARARVWQVVTAGSG